MALYLLLLIILLKLINNSNYPLIATQVFIKQKKKKTYFCVGFLFYVISNDIPLDFGQLAGQHGIFEDTM